MVGGERLGQALIKDKPNKMPNATVGVFVQNRN